MPKILTARNISNLTNLRFVTKDGVLTSVVATVEVNYGERGMVESVDVLSLMSVLEQEKIAAVYARIVRLIEQELVD
jgi:hypothetical protein